MNAARVGYRVKAGTLIITVVISLVIGLICTMLILLAYDNLRIRSDLTIENKLNRNTRSGIDRVLAGSLPPDGRSERALDLFGAGNDSVSILEEPWGVYETASVAASHVGRVKRKTFFFGSLLTGFMDGCLYLGEHQRSLSLSGATRLIGKAYLPKGGVKAAYIDQRGYDYTELVTGAVGASGDSLPAFDISRIRAYTDLPGKAPAGSPRDPLPDTMTRSFTDSFLAIHRQGPIVLNATELAGHILIISDSMIEVGPGARLENVLLTAPMIRFRKGFSGRVQAFATDSIVTEEGCNFYYPSSLVIVKKTGNPDQPSLRIGSNCLLEGMVLTWAGDDKNRTYMEIGAGAVIRGIVYCSGYLAMKGNVYGSVCTDFFIYRTPSVLYENFLVDARLDRGGLPDYFAGPVVFNGRKKNRIVQWVD